MQLNKLTICIVLCIYLVCAYKETDNEFELKMQLNMFNNNPVSLDAKSGIDYEED